MGLSQRLDRSGSPMCAPTLHRHVVQPEGGRCAFPDGRRADGLCGREPVAVYVNPYAKVLNTYRCERHDRDVVIAAAAVAGFRRMPLDTKAARVASLDRMLVGNDCE